MDSKIGSDVKNEPFRPSKRVEIPGRVEAIIELIVTRQDGTVRERKAMKSESFVRQFLDLLIVQMENIPFVQPLDICDTGNIIRQMAFGKTTFAANAPTGDAIFGIVSGTGNTAPTISDYALQTQIAHGNGAGQLQYGNVAFGLPASDDTTSSFTITRNFANASGNPITVNEIGLYVKAQEGRYDSGSRQTRYFMTIRDVLVGGIAVPNGETLTVNYRFQCVV